MSEFPGDETFAEEGGAPGYPADDPLGLEGGPAFEGGGPGPEPDPFAEVPGAVPEAGDELPPGVQPGTLGGESPSEMEPIDPEAEPPYEPGTAPVPVGEVEPGPGDLADDDLPDPTVAANAATENDGSADGSTASAPDLAPEDVGLGDEPPAPVEPEPDPLAGGATDQEVLTAPDSGGQDNTQLESEQTEPPGEPNADPAPEPSAEEKPAPKPRKKRRTKGPKLSPGQREYTILRSVAADGFDKPLWEEALGSPVIARSGELALRKAFRVLSENKPGEFELVPVPTKYWNPESVAGEVPDAALAIKVGGKKK